VAIKFWVSIDVPGNLDAADALSNLLQGEGEEDELKDYLKEAIGAWFAWWMPHVSLSALWIRIEQQ